MKTKPMQSDNVWEELLRKAPAPLAPPDLERRLIQQAARPRRSRLAAPSRWSALFGGEGNWAPVFALGVVMAALLTVLAVQQSALNTLKDARKNDSGDRSGRPAESTPSAEDRVEAELQQLRQQSAELQSLRTEMAGIAPTVAQLPQVAAENEALRAELSSLTNDDPAASPEIQAALAQARQRALRIKCVNNLKNVGLAARIWTTLQDDKKHLPNDCQAMKNELSTPRILFCPSDPARGQGQSVDNWEQFASQGGSYEILSPGIAEDFPDAVYARCPFHNNVLRVDGSVLQLSPSQQLIQRNGHWEVNQ